MPRRRPDQNRPARGEPGAHYTFGCLTAAERGAQPASRTLREMRAEALYDSLRADALGHPVHTLDDLVTARELRGWNPAAVLMAFADLLSGGLLRLDGDRIRLEARR